MEFTTLEVEAAPPRGRLTLNRPEKLNPLSTTTLQELAAAARWFDAQPGVKVVVVGGHGKRRTPELPESRARAQVTSTRRSC